MKKYGAAVVGLTLDQGGIPKSAEARMEVARRILERALALGIPQEDLYIDCLTLTVSAEQEGAAQTLGGLTNLEQLRLYSTKGVDLALLTKLQRLQELDLCGCTLKHPEALAAFPGLRALNLGETGLTEVSFLPELPVLVEVILKDNPIRDFTPLLDCPWLSG